MSWTRQKNIKNSQASWIDRSEGAVFEFKIENVMTAMTGQFHLVMTS